VKTFSAAENVTFWGDGVLEGVLERPQGDVRGGVVLSHPHPLMGGTMAQPVVYRSAEACRRRQFATLRFNFRGVGGSEGSYSGEDEYQDVAAAAAYLRERLRQPAEVPAPNGDASDQLPTPGPAAMSPFLGEVPLGLMGYSFGSVMSALAASEVEASALALVGFVVASETFLPAAVDNLKTYAGPILAVCGEYDELAPPQAVDRALREAGVDYRLETIRTTGHFFEGRQREVGEMVASFFADALS
jgi:alpha/beta superfamily hydrolase